MVLFVVASPVALYYAIAIALEKFDLNELSPCHHVFAQQKAKSGIRWQMLSEKNVSQKYLSLEQHVRDNIDSTLLGNLWNRREAVIKVSFDVVTLFTEIGQKNKTL